MNASIDRPAVRLSGAPVMRALPPLGLALVTCWLVWPAFAHAVEVWSTVTEFSHGFLVLPVSLLLIWWRRGALRRSLGPGATAGLPIVIASLALYLLAYRVGINSLAGLAVSPLLWASAVYLWGWGAGRVLAFPCGFLAFGLGLYRGLLDSVGFALQGVTALGAAALARALGVPVARDGLILHSEQFAFIVAEACSGMSSLLSLLALASLWLYLAEGSLAARLAVLLSVLPLVVLANSTRVALVLLVASWSGQDAALGFFHGASSLVLFGLALGGLALVSRMVGCKAPAFAASS
jgi:exosortase